MFVQINKEYEIVFAGDRGWTFTPTGWGRNLTVWGTLRKGAYSKHTGYSKEWLANAVALTKLSDSAIVAHDRLVMIRYYHR